VKRIVIELHIVVGEAAEARPPSSAAWPRPTAADIAAAHGVPTSVGVQVALGLGIGPLAFEPEEAAHLEVVLGERKRRQLDGVERVARLAAQDQEGVAVLLDAQVPESSGAELSPRSGTSSMPRCTPVRHAARSPSCRVGP
jgi:hypothetical protein